MLGFTFPFTVWLHVCISNPYAGDSLYPVPKDTNTPNIEDRQLSTKHTEILKNRICFTSPNLFRIVCNVIDPHGHKQPRNLVDEMTENIHQSKM